MRRLLIIGCGDVALRAVPQLRDRYRMFALTHRRERVPTLRAHGVVPLGGDLDDPTSLQGWPASPTMFCIARRPRITARAIRARHT